MQQRSERWQKVTGLWAGVRARSRLPAARWQTIAHYRGRLALTVCLVATVAVVWVWTRPTPLQTMAQRAAEGVAIVNKVALGPKGAPIFVLEESHGSRGDQIELALVLNRLYQQYGISQLVLEGYVKEDPQITTAWFARAAQGLSSTFKMSVAVRLLQEGEISQAEFMALAYTDFVLHPGELREHYLAAPFFEGWAAESYLASIVSRTRDTVWARGMVQRLQDTDPSLEQELTAREELVQKAQEASVPIPEDIRQTMDDDLTFLRARSASSETMVRSVEALADRQGVSGVAMVVGGSHTARIIHLLSTAQRPFAVLTSLSLAKEMARLSSAQFARKSRGEPINNPRDEGLTATLLRIFPRSKQRKHPSVLREDWFQARTALYCVATLIAQDGKLPVPYETPLVTVSALDPYTKDSNAFVFPIVLRPGQAAQEEIWGAVQRGHGAVTTHQRLAAEQFLKAALNKVQGRSYNRSEPAVPQRVQIDPDTIAIFGKKRHDVIQWIRKTT